jgi:uncharacterized protein (TIGR03435 family)
MRNTFLCILMAGVASIAMAQEFEVITVKPNKSGSGSSHSHSDPGMLTASNMSLRSMILQAYGMKEYQVEGPEWLRTEKFDIAAKFPEGMPRDREGSAAARRAMMKKMLVERFKLAVHNEQKMFAVYGLVVAKKGIKFQEVPDTGSHSNNDDTHYEGTGISMPRFAEFLSYEVDLPVLDMTGLTGAYKITLDWVREPRNTAETKSDVPLAADGPPGTNIATAIQDQLGLKLERRKAPIDILIVDHAERAPVTEN